MYGYVVMLFFENIFNFIYVFCDDVLGMVDVIELVECLKWGDVFVWELIEVVIVWV